MPRTDFILAIVQHTPVWVWALLVALVALGVMQAFPRRVSLLRAALLPLSMLALSLWGVVSVFGSAQAVAAWALGGLAAASSGLRAGSPDGARWSAAEQSFHLPGSWAPLALILGIFCTKFGVGVSLALHPGLQGDAVFRIGASLVYGIFSGIFMARALTLWRLARHALQARPA